MTLVEVVVALAILSLVVLALGASLRSMGQTAQRVDERVERIDEMRVAAAVLRDIFARVSLHRSRDGNSLLFSPQREAIAWIGVMPARFGAAGRFFFRLGTEPLEDGTLGLVLRYAPWNGNAQFPDWTRADHRVLVRGVSSFELAYGGEGMEAGWVPAWSNPSRMPPRVRLALETQSGTWPPLVVPLRLLRPDAGEGGFVTGGGAR